jgi:VWFA-related protein
MLGAHSPMVKVLSVLDPLSVEFFERKAYSNNMGTKGRLKTLVKLFVLLSACSLGFSQQSFVEQSLVINVEVPVRVFAGNVFVDSLGKDDFEVFEDGVPQKIESVYLVKKSTIERREEGRKFLPETVRRFYLFFELTEYIPKMVEAIEDFVQNILAPGDIVYVVTPQKTYQMKEHALELKSRKEIASELLRLIEKDSLTGNSEYRSTLDDLTNMAKAISTAIVPSSRRNVSRGALADNPAQATDREEGMMLDEQLIYYSTLLEKIDALRQIKQTQFADFAGLLKKQEGQKAVFLFYQREYIPQIDPKLLSDFMSYYQDSPYVYQMLTNVERFRKKQIPFDIDKIKQLYSDASTSIHFLYLSIPPERIEGIYLEEWSEDIFDAFREMTEATGGFFDSSANPAPIFHEALQAAENDYLLYYTPRKIEDTERAFRAIEVKVKKADYRILHRSGYYIN